MFKALKSVFTHSPKMEYTEETHSPKMEETHYEEDEEKEPVVKLCAYCKNSDHNVRHCDQMNCELLNMTNFCTSNQSNIPKVRKYLNTVDKRVINRYVQSKKLSNYMYQNCYEYFENNCKYGTKLEKYIEVIIGYLCVLPLNPQIKNRRQPAVKKPTIPTVRNNYFPTPGVYLNQDGRISIRIKLI
jgi:hypothetical protein